MDTKRAEDLSSFRVSPSPDSPFVRTDRFHLYIALVRFQKELCRLSLSGDQTCEIIKHRKRSDRKHLLEVGKIRRCIKQIVRSVLTPYVYFILASCHCRASCRHAAVLAASGYAMMTAQSLHTGLKDSTGADPSFAYTVVGLLSRNTVPL